MEKPIPLKYVGINHPLQNYLDYNVEMESPVDEWEMTIIFDIFERISNAKKNKLSYNLIILSHIEKLLLTKLYDQIHSKPTKNVINKFPESYNIEDNIFNTENDMTIHVNWKDIGPKSDWYQNPKKSFQLNSIPIKNQYPEKNQLVEGETK